MSPEVVAADLERLTTTLLRSSTAQRRLAGAEA